MRIRRWAGNYIRGFIHMMIIHDGRFRERQAALEEFVYDPKGFAG